jgi:hypothetical protein
VSAPTLQLQSLRFYVQHAVAHLVDQDGKKFPVPISLAQARGLLDHVGDDLAVSFAVEGPHPKAPIPTVKP